jgi:hypothetical protein
VKIFKGFTFAVILAIIVYFDWYYAVVRAVIPENKTCAGTFSYDSFI